MDNKLTYWNTGNLELNKNIFLSTMKNKFEIEKEDMQQIVGGYTFLFDSEYDSNITVFFLSTGAQLITIFEGEYAEDVIQVYNAFKDNFYNSNEEQEE